MTKKRRRRKPERIVKLLQEGELAELDFELRGPGVCWGQSSMVYHRFASQI